jgi:hypothetical protein
MKANKPFISLNVDINQFISLDNLKSIEIFAKFNRKRIDLKSKHWKKVRNYQ